MIYFYVVAKQTNSISPIRCYSKTVRIRRIMSLFFTPYADLATIEVSPNKNIIKPVHVSQQFTRFQTKASAEVNSKRNQNNITGFIRPSSH